MGGKRKRAVRTSYLGLKCKNLLNPFILPTRNMPYLNELLYFARACFTNWKTHSVNLVLFNNYTNLSWSANKSWHTFVKRVVKTMRGDKFCIFQVHQHMFNFMIVLSYNHSACGFFGPVLATCCFNDEMEDADWGISMALQYWVQMPFSLLSFVVVLLTPM